MLKLYDKANIGLKIYPNRDINKNQRRKVFKILKVGNPVFLMLLNNNRQSLLMTQTNLNQMLMKKINNTLINEKLTKLSKKKGPCPQK